MTLRERVYGALPEVVRAVSPATGLLSPALAASLAERRAAPASMAEWSRRGRDHALPLLWVHGASAGELAGVAPLLRALRRETELQLAATHFSPSGAGAAAALGPDWYGHPPFDTLRACRAAMAALLPDALLFAKWDVWPSLTRAAARAGVPLGLVNATVSPGSSRLRPPARWLFRPAYRRMRLVGAASPADAERLRRLGVREGAIRLTGDAAFAEALHRARAGSGAAAELRRLLGPGASDAGAAASAGSPPRLRLVAGSTWPEDEEALLAAAAELEARGVHLRLVVAPHRPRPEAVARLAARCREVLGRPALRWSEARGDRLPAAAPSPGAEGPLIVDETGVLAELYGAGDAAYVGGGLGKRGLHSVLEPAAAGVPVLFGSRLRRREADELVARRGGLAAPAEELATVLERWAREPEERREMGRRARAYAESGRGATGAGAALLLELLGLARPSG